MSKLLTSHHDVVGAIGWTLTQQVANPKERFMREAAKRDAPKGIKASIETDKDRETKEAIWHFYEARQKESEPLSPQPSG